SVAGNSFVAKASSRGSFKMINYPHRRNEAARTHKEKIMRRRHSTGSVRKQRGRWIGMWYADGRRKSKVVGFVRGMTKGEAKEEVTRIVSEVRARSEVNKAWK